METRSEAAKGDARITDFVLALVRSASVSSSTSCSSTVCLSCFDFFPWPSCARMYPKRSSSANPTGSNSPEIFEVVPFSLSLIERNSLGFQPVSSINVVRSQRFQDCDET